MARGFLFRATLGTGLICLALGLFLQPASSGGDEGEANHEALVKRDLFAVITLQGHHCVKVTAYEKQGKNDYVATCQTGDRFHVSVVPEGRVKVDKK